jgi:hypothetical protein
MRPVRRVLRTFTIAFVSILAATVVTPSGGAVGAAAAGPVRFRGQTPPLLEISSSQERVAASLGSDRLDARLYRLHAEREDETRLSADRFVNDDPAAPVTSNTPIMTEPKGRKASWEGLNHFDSRYSGGGNQFSGEPPDQGLCASNDRVFEIVNSVVQVYTTDGRALIPGHPTFPGTAPVGLTLNEFYGVPPAITRPDGPPFGPFMFDVSCLYDARTGRWFVVSDENDLDADTGAFSGPSAVYVAVSTTRDPLGSWNVWSIDTTNNGENGTPDHGCSSGFCFADYPQIGMDADSFSISVNEFDNIGRGEFHGAQLYVFSKAGLVAGDPTPTMAMIENIRSHILHAKAYTLQPVNALPNDWDTRHSGTTFFGMSVSPYTEVGGNATGVVLWALSNTSSLDTTPALTLHETGVKTEPYSVPVFARQADGPTPFVFCQNTPRCIGYEVPDVDPPMPLDAGAGKIYGAWLQDGVVYLTTGTTVAGFGGANFFPNKGHWISLKRKAGVAYFGLRPSWTLGALDATRAQQGYVAVERNNLIYPSIVVGDDGRGAIGATLSGVAYHPSQAYVPFRANRHPTSVRIAALGIGPWDGFTATFEGGYRPRWGDYPAAAIAPDGTMWLANEYIAQRCGYREWRADSTCGYTRTFYANWSTRITAVRF